MNLQNKNLWRLRFRILCFIIATSILIAVIYMDSINKDAKNLIAIAPSIFAFISAVFAIDYYTKPKD